MKLKLWETFSIKYHLQCNLWNLIIRLKIFVPFVHWDKQALIEYAGRMFAYNWNTKHQINIYIFKYNNSNWFGIDTYNICYEPLNSLKYFAFVFVCCMTDSLKPKLFQWCEFKVLFLHLMPFAETNIYGN